MNRHKRFNTSIAELRQWGAEGGVKVNRGVRSRGSESSRVQEFRGGENGAEEEKKQGEDASMS